MSGNLVRAIFDYQSTESSDLTFQVDEIIKVMYDVDENWICGELNGNVGNFPRNFITPIIIPNVNESQELFGAVKDFLSDVAGDLCFKRGDVITGEKQLDGNWWQGSCADRHGIFPLSHVRRLDLPSSTDQSCLMPSTPIAAPTTDTSVIATGKANTDLTAQLDDELGFCCGDLIEITRMVDSDFAIGSCHGKSGSFPLAFIDLIDGILPVAAAPDHKSSKFDWWKESDKSLTKTHLDIGQMDDSCVSAEKVCPAFSESHKQVVAMETYPLHGETGNVSNHEQSPVGAEYNGMPFCTPSYSYNQENTCSYGEDGVTPYGKTLFPFVAEKRNELTVFDNEIVKLIRHVDSEWIEGEIDGKRGIFPVSYVEIIVDCPHVQETLQKTSEETEPRNKYMKTFCGDTFGCVLFDFKAEKANDLDLFEGDTVRILGYLNEEWYEAENDGGRVGLCPVDYVELIPAESPGTVGTETGTAPSADHELDNNHSKHRAVVSTNTHLVKPANRCSSPTGKTESTSDPSTNKTLSSAYSKLDELTQLAVDQAKQTLMISSNVKITSMEQLDSAAPSASFNETTNRTSLPSLTFETESRSVPPPRPGKLPTSDTHSSKSNVLDFGPKPVPERAAPPRPSSRPQPALQCKRPTDNLIDFATNQTEVSGVVPVGSSEENVDVIEDLQRRREEAVTDAQNCEMAKSAMETQLLETSDELERQQLKDNIEFYSANITGLNQEIANFATTLCELNPEGVVVLHEQKESQQYLSLEERTQQQELLRQKRCATREKVIAEIMQTEKDYLHSLSLYFETFFHSDAFKCPGVDPESLLGNMDEVIEISQKLLNSLESAVNGREFDEQVVGRCFVELHDEMKRVYAPYCRNHDDVLTLLTKYEEDPLIQTSFQQMLDVMRKQMPVFDMGAILIKPVQRVLKYPLLLNELLKSTEDDHLDKEHLILGTNAMTDVAAAINECKRRKDLVLKYKSPSDVKFSDKMAKLNMHSTRKKLQRFSQKMVGIQTIDEDFLKEERKFKHLDSGVRQLVRDISCYVENAQLTTQAQEAMALDISDYYSDKTCAPDVEQFCKIYTYINNGVYYSFKEDMERNVINPFNRLLSMFQGPIKVIKKRHDKLLDYDNLSSRMRNTEQINADNESLHMAKNNYEALNAQLLYELPKLHNLSIKVVHTCIGHLVHAQTNYYNRALEQMYQMLGMPLILSENLDNIIGAFNISHTKVTEQLLDICFITKFFNTEIDDGKPSKGKKLSDMKPDCDVADSFSSQSDSQLTYLQQQFASNRLYVVKRAIESCHTLDLELKEGVVVGVIKEGDPMGNQDNWYVDTGVDKGFVMKKYLAPRPVDLMDVGLMTLTEQLYHCPEEATMSDNILHPISLTPRQPESFEHEFDQYFEDPATTVTGNNKLDNMKTKGTKLPNRDSVYQVVYEFMSRSELEVSLVEGETVQVIEFYDQDGNDEWWLVQTSSARGYAPSNYLYKVQE